MPVNRAARRMFKGIRRGGFEVTFPYRLSWTLKFLRLMPRSVYMGIVDAVTGWKSRPPNFDRRPKD
jgi:hypothetical protein